MLRTDGSRVRDLRMLSAELQRGTNPCAAPSNGGCDHLCLFNGTHPLCACAYARLAADGRSCQPYDEFLLYSNIRSIESLHLDVMEQGGGGDSTAAETRIDTPVQSIRHEQRLRNAIALGYDYANRTLFYSDISSHSINAVPFDGDGGGGAANGSHRVLVGKQLAVEGLCYEPLSHALFWTSNRNASVRSVRLAELGADAAANAVAVRTVVRLGAADKPRGIAVESCLGMVYWTNWNTQVRESHF